MRQKKNWLFLQHKQFRIMTASRSRKTETIIYVVIWAIVVGLYLLDKMRARAQISLPLLDATVLWNMVHTLFPFVVLFLVNNMLLIPRLLLKNRLPAYFAAAAFAVILVWVGQYVDFVHFMQRPPHGIGQFPHPQLRPLIPLPLLMDFTYAVLVVGCNIAIVLLFQRFDDKIERESLMKANAESQLAYLKSQINPHFYMNMLNNIHGMIEIDAEKAQAMVIDMSHLMRYMLYDSSKPLISLADEVSFIRNYLRLMRQRFPEDKLCIAESFPSQAEMQNINIAPLLFLVFIENAFKHGVSYRAHSFVNVEVRIEDSKVVFACINSCHPSAAAASAPAGIGLRNIRQRLDLLYGNSAELDIIQSSSCYTVNLTIPRQ